MEFPNAKFALRRPHFIEQPQRTVSTNGEKVVKHRHQVYAVGGQGRFRVTLAYHMHNRSSRGVSGATTTMCISLLPDSCAACCAFNDRLLADGIAARAG
jgi:hypothetical protein